MNARTKNISRAFEASLSFGFNKEAENHFSLNKEDFAITKYAGIYVYQPTIDNLETFIRKYTLNELAFLHKSLDIRIDVIPSEMNSANKEYIDEAKGMVTIKFLDAEIELPFMFIDGELVPFDVIQMNGQRVPYSKENLQKIFCGLEKMEREKDDAGYDKPYIGLEKRINPSTAPGFLGSTLRIREQALRQGGVDRDWVYASEFTDELLEKTANMKELTIEDLEKLEAEFAKKAYVEVEDEMEKIANEKITSEDVENIKLFEKVKELQFDNAYDLPNGTVIGFPERHDDEIVMTYGIIIDNFLGFAKLFPKKVKMVLSQDNRIKVLSQSEKFLCLKAPNVIFKVPHVNLSTLDGGDIFTGFDGNKAFFPCRVDYVDRRSFGSGDRRNDVEAKVYTLIPMHDDSEMASLFTDSENSNILNKKVTVPLCTLENNKFAEIPYGKFIKVKAEEMGMDEISTMGLFPKGPLCISWSNIHPDKDHNFNYEDSNMVMATDPETRVIKIKGVITDYIARKDDLDKLALENPADIFEKQASLEENRIKITLVDRELRIYDVDVLYIDKEKKMFNKFQKEWRRISKEDLRQLLRIAGFNSSETQEIIYKTNVNGRSMYELPKNVNIQALEGAQVKNIAKEKVKSTAKQMIDPKVMASTLATTIISTMLADTLMSSPDQVKNVVKTLGKFAEEEKALSVAFEKVATDKHSESALQVAKLMSSAAMFNEKVASTVTGDAVYPRIYDVSNNIIDNKEVLEKAAYDLIELKVTQYQNKNHIISPNYIQAAVNELDHMYKVAYAIKESKEDDNTSVCQLCGRPRDEKTEPQCKYCGHDSTITRKEYKQEHSNKISKEAFGFGNKKNNFNKNNKEETYVVEKYASKTPSLGKSLASGITAGALYGAGNSYQKSVENAKMQNPDAVPSDYSEKAKKDTIAGTAKGVGAGVLAGTAAFGGQKLVNTVKKKASEELDSMYKKSTINVPSEEEKKKENNLASKEDEELQDLDCEVCGYKGKPEYDGRCPQCGAIAGVKIKERDNAAEKHTVPATSGMENAIYEESARSFEG